MNHAEYLKQQVKLAGNNFIAPSADLIGYITLNSWVSVWYGAVLRADYDTITIGAATNIQDNAVLHVDEGVPIQIGSRCTVGHSAIIHGATIGDNTLIGMRATILNNAVIGNNCLIGAHALVTEGTVIPDNSLVIGVPGKVAKTVTQEMMTRMNSGVEHYLAEAKRYLEG